jgi:hypothetical protein
MNTRVCYQDLDLCDPRTESLGGAWFCLTVVCKSTRFVWTLAVKIKVLCLEIS